METSAFSVLVAVAFVLLVAVSGGILYLTLAEWRDRRRRDQDEREINPKRRRSKA